MDLVSVIVPVYKVEKYLRDCINSLLNQTYKNLEIILIDDESPDNCPLICDEFAAMDMRVSVIHQQNGGAGKARNTGLSRATGKYICFVDSDDLVDKDYVLKLVQAIEQTNADIAVCSYYNLYKNRKEKKGYNGGFQVMTQCDFLLLFLNDWTCSLIWNKIFKREVIGKIRFVEGHKIDDEFFTYQVVIRANKIALFNDPLYEYRMRASSVMNSSNQYNNQAILKDRLEYIIQRYHDVSKTYPEIRLPYLKNMVDNLIILWKKGKNNPKLKGILSYQINAHCKEILLSNIGFKLKYSFIKKIYIEQKNSIDTKYELKNKKDLFE